VVSVALEPVVVAGPLVGSGTTDGFDSRSVNVSSPSFSVSSTIGTETVLEVSDRSNVSVPDRGV
jgi:hypothetical protein